MAGHAHFSPLDGPSKEEWVICVEKLTNSRIQTRQRCPQREAYQYEQRLRPRGYRWPLITGTAFHAAMEAWGNGGSVDDALTAAQESFGFIDRDALNPDEQYKFDLEKVRTNVYVRAALRTWQRYPAEAVEHEFAVPIKNPQTGRVSRSFELGGKADLVVEIEGMLWLVEYKTTGLSLDQYRETFGLALQPTIYVYALSREFARPFGGVLMRTIAKTRVEPKKKGGEVVESLSDYERRLDDAYGLEPERYISEDWVIRTPERLAELERDLWLETKERLWAKKLGVIRRNAAACTDFGGCPFKSICLDVPGWESQYYVSPTTHDELPSEVG